MTAALEAAEDAYAQARAYEFRTRLSLDAAVEEHQRAMLDLGAARRRLRAAVIAEPKTKGTFTRTLESI